MTTPTPAQSEEVARIAEGLSEAQRRWIKIGRKPAGNGKWPVLNALVAKGLAKDYPWCWTPLGLAVRHHLTKDH